jgi:hypothetical protein
MGPPAALKLLEVVGVGLRCGDSVEEAVETALAASTAPSIFAVVPTVPMIIGNRVSGQLWI